VEVFPETHGEKTLLVSWGLPPLVAGSAVIVTNLARQFSPDEMILAGERPAQPPGEPDESLPHRTYYLMREWTWPRRGRRFVHWIRWAWLPLAAWRLARIIRKEHCTAVLAVFPNEFYLAAAYIAASWTNTKLFPYFHNTYLENRRGASARFARWLQPRVFSAAETVFVMSDGMKRFYEPLYPETRFVPLVHSFNEPLDESPSSSDVHAPLRLAFVGNLNDSNIDAMKRMAELANRRSDCTLTIYSGTSKWFFEKVGIALDRFTFTQLPYDEITAALKQHDILLLPHGFEGGLSESEYRTIFPTRTLSCLLSGRPILAHSPPEAFLTQWIRQHDCAEIVDEPSTVKLEKALDQLVCDASRRRQLAQNALNAARQFRAPVVARRLREYLFGGNSAECVATDRQLEHTQHRADNSATPV
jgi:glycosyltransferase involved in cell wall biosynthesis